MIRLLCFVLAVLASPFKSKLRLEAENAVLRHQLIVLRPSPAIDVAEWLVRNGLALDWRMYSRGKYERAQRDAEHVGRGIGAGSYVEPWRFRACVGQGGRLGECSDDANMHP